MEQEKYDVLVIGGGITGCGIALDAATRGVKTALVEMQDYAAGTSSRSTKLVHGGLRYLKQFEVKMVAEVGKERAIVYENGPHVTSPEWMLLPIHQGGTFGKFSTSIGLFVYDFLAGVKRSERRKMLSVEETLKHEPLLKKEGLKGGGYYVEYKTDDARLTIEVVKEAVKQGATAVNYTKVEEFIYENGKVKGVKVVDQLTKNSYNIYANKIVNAAGPWVDSLREKDQSRKGKSLQLTKGVHLVIDQSRFPLNQAIYFDTPDGRMVFAIPREGKPM
jgi:glycerol-3-phosphate dehydrogenase